MAILKEESKGPYQYQGIEYVVIKITLADKML